MVTQVTTTAGNTRWGTPYGIQRRRVFKHRATILTRVSEGWLLGDIQKAIGLDDMPYKTFAGLVLKLKNEKKHYQKKKLLSESNTRNDSVSDESKNELKPQSRAFVSVVAGRKDDLDPSQWEKPK